MRAALATPNPARGESAKRRMRCAHILTSRTSRALASRVAKRLIVCALRTFGPLVVTIAHAVATLVYYGQYGTAPGAGSILLSLLFNALAIAWVVLRLRDAKRRGGR